MLLDEQKNNKWILYNHFVLQQIQFFFLLELNKQTVGELRRCTRERAHLVDFGVILCKHTRNHISDFNINLFTYICIYILPCIPVFDVPGTLVGMERTEDALPSTTNEYQKALKVEGIFSTDWKHKQWNFKFLEQIYQIHNGKLFTNRWVKVKAIWKSWLAFWLLSFCDWLCLINGNCLVCACRYE